MRANVYLACRLTVFLIGSVYIYIPYSVCITLSFTPLIEAALPSIYASFRAMFSWRSTLYGKPLLHTPYNVFRFDVNHYS